MLMKGSPAGGKDSDVHRSKSGVLQLSGCCVRVLGFRVQGVMGVVGSLTLSAWDDCRAWGAFASGAAT